MTTILSDDVSYRGGRWTATKSNRRRDAPSPSSTKTSSLLTGNGSYRWRHGRSRGAAMFCWPITGAPYPQFLELMMMIMTVMMSLIMKMMDVANVPHPARGYDVICLTPAGGHIVGRHHNASVLDAVRKMSQRSRSTKNCVAYGFKNVYDKTARNAGISFHV